MGQLVLSRANKAQTVPSTSSLALWRVGHLYGPRASMAKLFASPGTIPWPEVGSGVTLINQISHVKPKPPHGSSVSQGMGGFQLLES
jgi:hypothetical protein